MRRLVFTSLFALAVSAGATETRCDITPCPAGAKVVTYATKSEMFYACPTTELAEYTNFVLGLITVQYTLTGTLPNVSPATGEPEYQGETKSMISVRRNAAKVRTFDQATALCKEGKKGWRLLIANNPPDKQFLWAFDEKTKQNLWYPKSALDLRK